MKVSEFTLSDWLTNEDRKKLVEALTKSPDYTHVVLTVAKNNVKYYVNGQEVIRKPVKK